jgi:hypothetical protein
MNLHTLALAATLVASTAISAFADTPYLRQLPRTDAFRSAADAIGTRLRDEVISTGTFDIGAMHVVGGPKRALTDRELSSLNLDLAGKIAKMHDDTLPKDLATHTTVKPFGPERVAQTGKHLSSVYAYAPESGETTRLAKTVWVLVGKAGVKAESGQVVTSRSRFWDSSTGTHKYFTQTLFYNGETRRALVLYMISGTM